MASTFSGVIESFIKPEALKEFDTLGSKLDASLEGFDKIIAKAATLSTEIQKGAGSFTAYTQQLKKITDTNTELQKSQQQITTGLGDYNTKLKAITDTIKENTGATDDQARRIIALRTELSKTKDAVEVYQKLIREVNKENPASLSDKTFNQVFDAFGSETANNIKAAFDNLDNTTKPEFIAQLSKDAADFLEIQKQLEQELKDVSIAFRLQTKEAISAEDSIVQLDARLQRLNKAYDLLSKQDRNTEFGQELEKQINDLDKELKTLDSGLGRTRRLVGDYANQIKQGLSPAFQILEDRLNEVNNTLRDQIRLTRSAQTGLAQGSGPVNPAEGTQRTVTAVRELVKEQGLLNVVFQKGAVASSDLTAQNKALEKTLIGLDQANLKGSETYKIVQQELVKGKKAVGDLRQETKALQSETRNLDLVISAATGLAAIYQTGAAAAELFGAETEDTQKAIAKLVAIQSVLNGLQTIQAQLFNKTTALGKLYAFAQGQVAIATDASAASTLRLRAALITVGFGAIIIAIGLLITNLDKLKSAFNPAIASANELEAATRRQYDASLKAIEGFDLEARALKALGFSEDEIKKKKIERTRAAIFAAQIELKALDAVLSATLKAYSKTDFLRNNPNVPGGNLIASIFGASEEEVGKAITDANNIKGKIEELGVLLLELENPAPPPKPTGKSGSNNAIDIAEKDARAQLEIFRLLKEQQIKDANDVAAFNINDAELQVALAESVAQSKRAILQAELQFKLRFEKLTANELQLVQKQNAQKEEKIAEELINRILEIRVNAANRFKSSDQGIDAFFSGELSPERQIAALEKASQDRINIIERTASIELLQLEKYRAEGLITEERYNEEILRINTEKNGRLLEEAIKVAKARLAVLKAAGVDTLKAEKELADAEAELLRINNFKQLSDSDKKNEADPLIEQNKKRKASFEELADAYKNLALQINDTIFAFIDGEFVKQNNALQDQIDLIEERKGKEIQAINESTASNEDKANRIKIIEATTQAQREQLERRQRQIELERARYQRAAQVAAIIGNTAQAVTKTLAEVAAPAGIALAVAIGAIGALQLATLLSTPLPKFLHGKKSSYEGLAEVSEDGRPELYIDRKRGVVGLTPAKHSIMHVTAESEIIPHNKIKDYLNYTGMGSVPMLSTNGNNSGDVKFMSDPNLINAIKNKKLNVQLNVVNNLGWYDHIKKHIFN